MKTRLAVLLFPLFTSCTPAVRSVPAPAAEARFSDEVFAGPGGTRAYKIFVPGGLPRRAPLLVMLHGCTQDPADFAVGTRINELADSAGVIVAYPEQPASANPQKCWNWYLPEHQSGGTGEPAQIAALTRDVISRLPVDPSRVYVAGISAGGAMALILAATQPELYAAAAVHSAVPVGSANSVAEALAVMRGQSPRPLPPVQKAVPLLAIHGSADAVVAPANLQRIGAQWATAAGLDPATAQETREEAGGRPISRAILRNSQGRVVQERWTVEGLGHAWSGGSPAGSYTDPQGPDASRAMLQFLLQHSKR